MMPELNGVEICEKIRNHYKDQDVIIIFYQLEVKNILKLHVMMQEVMIMLKNQ